MRGAMTFSGADMTSEPQGEWHPINENHAIDVMAVVVGFSQPIPDLLLKKALRVSEETAFSLGLKSRHQTVSMQLNVSPKEGLSPSPFGGIQGKVFSSSEDTPEGSNVPSRLNEQLQVDQNSVIYRTWRYVSWAWQIERIKKLMVPALEVVSSSVTWASLRLEYLDRFRFDGVPLDAKPEGLLRTDSTLVSPHIFQRSDLWHSHTGAYIDTDGSAKRLLQMMIDAIDEPLSIPDANGQVRWINLTTALEDRFIQPTEDSVEEGIGPLFESLETMHSSLKDTLATVLTDEMAQRIYLRNK